MRLPSGRNLPPPSSPAAGYVFGRSVINVIRCQACPKDAQPDLGKLHIEAEPEKLLAGVLWRSQK